VDKASDEVCEQRSDVLRDRARVRERHESTGTDAEREGESGAAAVQPRRA